MTTPTPASIMRLAAVEEIHIAANLMVTDSEGER